MKKYGIFVAATANYIGYLNALLSSIEKRKLHRDCELHVHVFHFGDFPADYIYEAIDKYSYNLHFDRMLLDEIPLKAKFIEYVKRTRYHKIVAPALNYDVSCLLDCDMFFVSDQFMRLFEMVDGTDLLIGCNEKIKWEAGKYTIDGEKIVENPGKMFQFICNTPAIFNMERWKPVFEKYIEIAIHGRQMKGDRVAGIGDLHCWNIAINACKRNNDVVVFPMETMAQVHYTNMRAWTYPIVERGYWRTEAGDRIYVIHGRVARDNMVEGCMKKYFALQVGRPDIHKIAGEVRKGLVAIEKEWNELNYNGKIDMEKYINR